jgi:hypothetical protein
MQNMILFNFFIKGERTMPRYGDKTAKKLDNYLQNYTIPVGKTKTGLAAPAKDMFRNYDTMKNMKLKESDPFFHCKANYEATKRGGLYGLAVANVIDTGKEIKDLIVSKYPLDDSLRDYRANLKGQKGALQKKSLEETCPTHHTKYK